MIVKFTPEGLINVTLSPDELVMWMLTLTSNISPSSILEKESDEQVGVDATSNSSDKGASSPA